MDCDIPNSAFTGRPETSVDIGFFGDMFLNNCPDMNFIFDERLCLAACGIACSHLLRDDDIGKAANTPLKEIFSLSLDKIWIHKIFEKNKEVLRDHSPLRFDDEINFSNGEHVHMRITISPLLDEAQNCRGTIMTMSDITEIFKIKQQAEAEARSKSSFLANMSHEIRTPMNAVKGLSELLALTELNNLQRNYVKNIISSANSLLGIINDVLDFSKIDANKIKLIDSPYDLDVLITGACNSINMRASEKNLLLIIEASPDLPLTLMGDDVRIKQILTNLLSNSVKYTHAGHVCLVVYTEEKDGNSWLCFGVEDSGIGIREEDLPVLFDAFSRVDLVSNRDIMGTGLGLAISKQLAIAMGGDIEVRSKYGNGSVFTLRIPLRVSNPRPIAKIEDAGNKHVLLMGTGDYMRNLTGMLVSLDVSYTCVDDESALDELLLSKYTHCISNGSFSEKVIRSLSSRMPSCLFSTLKNMNNAMSISDYHDTIFFLPVFITDLSQFLNRSVQDAKSLSDIGICGENKITLQGVKALIVDDNEINLLVSSDILRYFNAEVTCAGGGDEAIALCGEQKFDIIYMDYMMPLKDGIETTIEIRKGRGPNTNTPIVALTASVVNDMKTVYLESGMNDFLSKPIEIAELSRTLQKWLPKEKVILQGAASKPIGEGALSGRLTPEGLIAALDQFGLYASDVMREMNGDFFGYISRMEDVSSQLDGLVEKLEDEVSEENWDDFARDCQKLHEMLYGIGARDCAARARLLAAAGCERSVSYIRGDFFSLMGNMYMLGKKLAVIIPFARGDGTEELPLSSPEFLHGCLEKMGRALSAGDKLETMRELEIAASFSLDMDLDMSLKAIKADLEAADFKTALEHQAEIFRAYTEQILALRSENVRN